MQTKILCIQFRNSVPSLVQEQFCIKREVGTYADIDFVSAIIDPIDWSDVDTIMSGYHGVILGGSGDYYFDGERLESDPARKASYEFLEKLRPLFTYLFDNDIPTLGICYGHQLLGAFAGARVQCDKQQKKTCSHEIKLMVDKNDYFLFSDLPESFHAHYGHQDSLDRVPEGAILLMNGGDQCKVSALKYKNNIYTTQFHPELTFEDMVDRMRNSSGYLPEGVIAEEIFSTDPHSNTILRNFGKFVAMRNDKSSVSV